jgi:predicted dehydrogenase
LLSAMRQQKHIYCDKPLVATLAEAEEIEGALQDYRGTAQMTFQNRFFPATLRAKQLVAAGALGDVLEFRANYLHAGNANPDAPLKWKLTAAAGGGVIADLASHVLDLVEHLLGPLRSLSAATHIAYPQRPACGVKETGDRSQESGVRSQESGDRSQESGDRREEENDGNDGSNETSHNSHHSHNSHCRRPPTANSQLRTDSSPNPQSLISNPQSPAPNPQSPIPAPQRLLPVDAEDSVMLLARLVSGALGTIGATKLATGSEDEMRLEIHGSRGALRFNLMDPHHLEFYDATLPEGPLGGLRGWNRIDTGQRYAPPAAGFPSPKAAIGWLRGHVACLANFLQAVADGRPAVPGLDQGIRIQRLMDCVRRSAAGNCWLDVPPP